MTPELEKKLKHYRMNAGDFERATELLGREPQGLEWALFSALWSEHCSYKSSKVHLRKLFNKSPRVVTEEGENAGVIDLGQGERVAFKMESHNHPSYIEPFQGAATGVGGILRDIFTMGARPVALANYLCFGMPEAARMPALVDGVVRGISSYGNCVGVPNITGQTEFHPVYNKNILVNALALGLFRPGDPIMTAKARGVGNLVVYVGAKTGRDGIHGASMASESFDDEAAKQKPTVQKGDPFYEKLLIESCLEVMKENLVVAIQDMGAAGLTSSSFEMAARGQVGLKLHLDRVPLRDSTLTPEDILLSESQERMLMIVEPRNLDRVRSIFSKWELDAETIGTVTKGPDIELFWHDECLCRIQPEILVDKAPRYERPYEEWTGLARGADKVELKVDDVKGTLLRVLSDVRGTSRRWIYEQYDQRVGCKTVNDCAEPVGVIKLPDSGRYLGLVLGGRPHVMRFDARIGGMDAAIFPALELAAKGFLPLALTDCLNFGNPESPKIMSEFVASLEGMSEICEELHAPVISGNVSFYNETLGENITSTPATGLVGIRDHTGSLPKSRFVRRLDEIYILRTAQASFTGMMGEVLGQETHGRGELNAKELANFCRVTRHLALIEGVTATNVVGKFGLAYTLARMSNEGLNAVVKDWNENPFIENLYDVVVAVSSSASETFRSLAEKLLVNSKFELKLIGHVREGDLEIDGARWTANELNDKYQSGWEANFAGLS